MKAVYYKNYTKYSEFLNGKNFSSYSELVDGVSKLNVSKKEDSEDKKSCNYVRFFW